MGKFEILKKITVSALAMFIAFGAFACGANGDDNVQYSTPAEEHFSTKGLHKVNVKETTKPFVVNGISEYKIVVPEKMVEEFEYGISFFVKYINKATGAILPVIKETGVDWSANEKMILFGCEDAFEKAGLTMPSDKLGESGYYIKTIGNSVFVATEQSGGYQHAILSLLDHIVGYEYYGQDVVAFEKDGSTLPDMDIVEKPDYPHLSQGNCTPDREVVYAFGQTRSFFHGTGGVVNHNAFEWLPPEQWKGENPEWYSDDNTQLCYTAHGDPEKYEAMLNACMDVLKDSVQDEEFYAFTLSEEDAPTMCTCSACSVLLEKYNTAGASMLMFLNDLDDKLQVWLEEKAERENLEKKQTVEIYFFAYYQSLAAPVKEVNGELVPIDENVVGHDSIGVYIAPIEAVYNKSFYQEENIAFANVIKGWGACVKNIAIWYYGMNASEYFYPQNTWESLPESYRFAFDNNAKYMMNQGQYETVGNPAFSEFKEYLDSKLCFNVNYTFEELKQKYFHGYFGDAAEPMLQFYNELLAHMRYIEVDNSEVNFGHIHAKVAQSKFWPRGLLLHWLGLIDQAYERIEKYKISDPALYNILHRNINIESMFPRFAMINHNSGYYTESELRKMKDSFEADCSILNITYHHEGVPLTDMFNTW